VAAVAVVGAGPAGMMAAIAAAEGVGVRSPAPSRLPAPSGAPVVLLEQLDGPGAKLLATGGGRCNLTNTLPLDRFMAAFGREGRFMHPALATFGSAALRKFLEKLGLPTHAPDGLHVFPASDSAKDVLRVLRWRLKELGVDVRTGTRATGLWIDGRTLKGLQTDAGRLAAARVVLATGGKGYPDLGATGTGYDLARQAGHTIATPLPALVPLRTRETWPGDLAGVSVSPARIWIDLPRFPKAGLAGDILFTHTGISGPAVLDLSGDVSSLLATEPEVPVRIDLAPGTTADQWLGRLREWAETNPRQRLRALLDETLPRSLTTVLCFLAEVSPETHAAQVSAAAGRALAEHLTALPLAVTGTEGWGQAMVTRGGVSLKEVNPLTLQSKRLAGLMLAGEVLDLDGPCGGFNLQWAMSSGRLAGASAARP
jgi:predicted Rossmann fold flavoprotein